MTSRSGNKSKTSAANSARAAELLALSSVGADGSSVDNLRAIDLVVNSGELLSVI